MMPINDFPGNNMTLQRPPSMTEEECTDLRARAESTYRGPQYTTCWQPSYEDVKGLETGKALVIEIGTMESIFVGIDTKLQEYPALHASRGAVIWLPGPIELADLKSGKRVYVTFVCNAFPVISVYVNE